QPEDEAAYDRWLQNRLLVKMIVRNSFSKVWTLLEENGYDQTSKEDLFIIFNLVKKVIPKTSEDVVVELAEEFSAIRRNKFDPLKAFNSRVFNLTHRLNEQDCAVSDKMKMIRVMSACKKSYQD